MKTLLIGGTGQVGDHLVKDLLKMGADITIVSRGFTKPVENEKLFSKVRLHTLDRKEAEKSRAWEIFLASQKFDIVVDFMAFEPRSAEIIYKTLRRHIKHYIFVATSWMYGQLGQVPALEDVTPLNPEIPYAKKKYLIHQYLMNKFKKEGFPVTSITPTQITGPGKECVTPRANHDMVFFEEMAAQKSIVIPTSNLGLVQHVHPKDIAQLISLCIHNPQKSMGQLFNASADYALGYEYYARWIANVVGNKNLHIKALSFQEYLQIRGQDEEILNHHLYPSCVSVAKAKYLLNYKPEYSPEEAVLSCLDWQVKNKKLNIRIRS